MKSEKWFNVGMSSRKLLCRSCLLTFMAVILAKELVKMTTSPLHGRFLQVYKTPTQTMSQERVITRRRLPPTVAVAITSRTSTSEGDSGICTDVIGAISFAGHDFSINKPQLSSCLHSRGPRITGCNSPV